MVEMLRREHQVTIFASHDAFALLSSAYRDSDVEVVEIPGLRHGYGHGGHLSLVGSALGALPFLLQVRSHLAWVTAAVASRRPDLVITDFEPLLPRAARRLKVPFISLDHQRFLVECDFSGLPPRLSRAARFLSLFVRAFYSGQELTVISSFFVLPLKASRRRVMQVGVLLRPELERATITEGDHLVAYLRRGAASRCWQALAGCGREVRVYGAGVRPPEGKVSFRPISEEGFIADLASAAALVTTAGNQVVGEAVALGKPVLALPESGNLEQELNAYFVHACGAGHVAPFAGLETRHVQEFCSRLPELKVGLGRLPGKGNDAALAAVERHLPPRRQRHRPGPLPHVLLPQPAAAAPTS
jgi:uncharacterized protein (TIGR00661 family)